MLGLLWVAALAGAGFVAQSIRSPTPFALRLVSVGTNGDYNLGPVDRTKAVTVEFRRLNPTARLFLTPKVQTRIAGRWQAPEKFPDLDSFFLGQTNLEQITFLMPTSTQACRFSMQYRVGKSIPYCRLYFFLERHGWSKRFPLLSRLVLKCVPYRVGVKHWHGDLVLPAQLQSPAGLAESG